MNDSIEAALERVIARQEAEIKSWKEAYEKQIGYTTGYLNERNAAVAEANRLRRELHKLNEQLGRSKIVGEGEDVTESAGSASRSSHLSESVESELRTLHKCETGAQESQMREAQQHENQLRTALREMIYTFADYHNCGNPECPAAVARKLLGMPTPV